MNSFEILAASAGLGAALDQVFLGSSERKTIRTYLQENRAPATFVESFYEYLGVVNAVLFERYFGSKFGSRRFILNSIRISFVYLVLITCIHVYFSWKFFSGVEWSVGQIALLIFCILSNFFIDWLSIGLTAFLFTLSLNAGGFWRSVVLIVVDFVVTLTLFTIVYSGALALALMVVHYNTRDAEMSASFKAVPYDITNEVGWIYGGDDTEIREARAFLGHQYYQYLVYVAGIGVDQGLAQGFHLTNPQQFLASDSSITLADLVAIANNSRLLPEGAVRAATFSASGDTKAGRLEKLNVSLGRSVGEESFSLAQSAAFSAVESVQTSFPDSIGFRASGVSLADLEGSYSVQTNSATIQVYGATAFACEYAAKLGRRWAVQYSHRPAGMHCLRAVLLPAAQIAVIPSIAVESAFASYRYYVPINTLFMTSFGITLTIYALMTMLILAKFAVRIARHSGVLTRFFGRSPFAAFGILIGLGAVVVFNWSF